MQNLESNTNAWAGVVITRTPNSVWTRTPDTKLESIRAQFSEDASRIRVNSLK